MAYELPPLPYDYNALEPYIDEQTMRIHHDKHHGTYVTNVNNALANQPDLAALPVEQLIQNLTRVPDDIRTDIMTCTDTAQLEAWIRRAATADKIQDVLD